MIEAPETVLLVGTTVSENLDNLIFTGTGTILDNSDTDGDGVCDYGPDVVQDELGLVCEGGRDVDPLDPNSDTDGDGVSDIIESTDNLSSPVLADTDGDGLDDNEEINEHGTDPRLVDTDGDGVSDADEIEAGDDPTVAAEPEETLDAGSKEKENVVGDEEAKIEEGCFGCNASSKADMGLYSFLLLLLFYNRKKTRQ